MHANTREDINKLMVDWYEFNNNQQQAPEKNSSARGDTERQIYKHVWVWNGI